MDSARNKLRFWPPLRTDLLTVASPSPPPPPPPASSSQAARDRAVVEHVLASDLVMSLTHEALLFSPTREGVPSSDDNFTADDLIAAQDALEAEARDALPFSFAQCTYDLGYLKQPLFACRTCLNDSAVCAACSISCHGEHELVELFNRRVSFMTTSMILTQIWNRAAREA